MDEAELEGTKVLEKLAEIGKVDDFLESVDADDFSRAKKLMGSAGIGADTIELVLKKMASR